jgi:hypothetical protein
MGKHTESEGHLPFLDLDIYRGPDDSLGHKVYRDPTHTNLYVIAKSHHYPSNKQEVPELFVMNTACRPSWVFLKDVFKQNGYNDRQIHRAVNSRPHLPQPDNEPNSVAFLPFVGTIQPHKQSAGPTQHQICGLAPQEIIQSPPSGQRPPWTKDTRGLQDPL